MSTLLLILAATVVNSLLGLIGVFTLWFRPQNFQRLIRILVAFSAGTLLGAAFFHLLAEAAPTMGAMRLYLIAIAGFLTFFVLEEYLHWHLCEECDIHPYSYLMVIGDAMHNFLDGLVIAGAFVFSLPVGLVTTLVILSHELPQELGVFAVIVSGGIEKLKAISWSFIAQTTCILGGVIGFLALNQAQGLSAYILPFAAGGFIYIAAADLIPSMHKTEGLGKITSFAWLCCGLIFMILVKKLFGA